MFDPYKVAESCVSVRVSQLNYGDVIVAVDDTVPTVGAEYVRSVTPGFTGEWIVRTHNGGEYFVRSVNGHEPTVWISRKDSTGLLVHPS